MGKIEAYGGYPYGGWANCYYLSNGIVELVLTGDVGPRIIRFGFAGGENELREFPDMLGQSGGEEWRVYGGHRLWHAPEEVPRTYVPDNRPVKIEPLDGADGAVRVTQPTEPVTGIEKQIDLRLSPDQAHVTVTHRLRNKNLWAVELAPWALSVMAQGGVGILPLPPRGSHPADLQPTSTLALWSYTDLSDPRWNWGKKYVLVRQDPAAVLPQKVGAIVPDGWVAYARGGRLFVKTFDSVPGARYPDLNCSAEIFTNADILEAETLGPLVSLQPGAAVEHVEHWFLFDGVPVPRDDGDVDRDVLPRVKAAQSAASKADRQGP
jgi:hypothetical protein